MLLLCYSLLGTEHDFFTSWDILFYFHFLAVLVALQIEMIHKIIAHMAANDRAIIAEGLCGSPRSIKVFLGECNVDELY